MKTFFLTFRERRIFLEAVRALRGFRI